MQGLESKNNDNSPSKNENIDEKKSILESIFLLKEMGFSIAEMELFTMTEFFELVDIHIEKLEKISGNREEVVYEATQEDIDRFLG